MYFRIEFESYFKITSARKVKSDPIVDFWEAELVQLLWIEMAEINWWLTAVGVYLVIVGKYYLMCPSYFWFLVHLTFGFVSISLLVSSPSYFWFLVHLTFGFVSISLLVSSPSYFWFLVHLTFGFMSILLIVYLKKFNFRLSRIHSELSGTDHVSKVQVSWFTNISSPHKPSSVWPWSHHE